MLDARGVTLDMPKAGMMAIVALMHTHRVAKKKETSAKHTASGCYVCGCKKHTWHMTMQYFNQLVAKIFEYLAKIKLQRMNEHLHTMCGAAVYVKHKY